ncbi:Uncharacterised protein [Mycobacterium tuberculosis]|nr:Uncharacterised protein [Mycobacterium tuberculosis]
MNARTEIFCIARDINTNFRSNTPNKLLDINIISQSNPSDSSREKWPTE